MLGIKHPIRDMLVYWMGKRLWRRHERKEARKSAQRTGRPFTSSNRISK
jgi:hypothetical protein